MVSRSVGFHQRFAGARRVFDLGPLKGADTVRLLSGPSTDVRYGPEARRRFVARCSHEGPLELVFQRTGSMSCTPSIGGNQARYPELRADDLVSATTLSL